MIHCQEIRTDLSNCRGGHNGVLEREGGGAAILSLHHIPLIPVK